LPVTYLAMKVTSFLGLVATATLVSAGRFIPTGQRPAVNFVPGAFIIEVSLKGLCRPL
jgi:hypothetical protein